jgi:hemoglobin-like flavoprotein
VTPRQIELVQSTWQQVLPAAGPVATIFYRRLFELDATLEPLFRGDLQAQGDKLMAALDFVVRGLTDLPQRMPAVQALARRHATYGVQPEHFDTVGRALLWTLERGLGQAATEEVLAAWAAAYGMLATAMKQAAWPATRMAPEWAVQAG